MLCRRLKKCSRIAPQARTSREDSPEVSAGLLEADWRVMIVSSSQIGGSTDAYFNHGPRSKYKVKPDFALVFRITVQQPCSSDGRLPPASSFLPFLNVWHGRLVCYLPPNKVASSADSNSENTASTHPPSYQKYLHIQ